MIWQVEEEGGRRTSFRIVLLDVRMSKGYGNRHNSQ